MLTPRKPTPDLNLPLVGGGTFSLSGEGSDKGTVVCFYRGLHCPLCAKYLDELAKLTPEFEKRGVTTVAVSSDTEDRAQGIEIIAVAADPGFKSVAPGKGVNICAPVSVCHQVSTVGHTPRPTVS